MHKKEAGFREIEHTADVELEVWGADIPTLFAEAAKGMYHLSQIKRKGDGDPQATQHRSFTVQGTDLESLLVAFLSELLFYLETEGLVFDAFDLRVQEDSRLQAQLEGFVIEGRNREIKAITFHNLNIKETESGLQVHIVFDV
ncbi:MAG: archease [Anaerolineales bacterium]